MFLSFTKKLSFLGFIPSNIIFLISIDVDAGTCKLFILTATLYSVMGLYHNLFSCSSTNGHLGFSYYRHD